MDKLIEGSSLDYCNDVLKVIRIANHRCCKLVLKTLQILLEIESYRK